MHLSVCLYVYERILLAKQYYSMSISLALLVGAAVLSEAVRTQEGVYKYPIHRKKCKY